LERFNYIAKISRIIIGLSLLGFITFYIYNFIESLRNFYYAFGYKLRLIQVLEILYYSKQVIVPFALILAVSGFFIHNKIGWISITSLFYFITFEIIFIVIPSSAPHWSNYFIILIPLIIIFLLNLEEIIMKYRLNRSTSITLNMIAIIIGLSLTYLQGYIEIYHDFSIWELEEKIR